MKKRMNWRGVVALCLASALLMPSLGCQPGGGSGSAPGTNKSTNPKPDNKDKPAKPPPHEPG